MIIRLFLILSLSFPVLLIGQEDTITPGISFGIWGSNDYILYDYSYTLDSLPDIPKRNVRVPNYSIGIFFHKDMNHKLHFHLGALYSTKRFDIRFNPNANTISLDPETPALISFKAAYLDIPFGWDYRLFKKPDYDLAYFGNIIPGILLYDAEETEYENGSVYQTEFLKTEYNSFTFSSSGGILFRYHITRGVNFGVMPYFRTYFISPNENISSPPNSYGATLWMEFSF